MLTLIKSVLLWVTVSHVTATKSECQAVGFDCKAQVPLSEIRDTLIRLEDTITFGFIERAQYKLNDKIYSQGGFELPNESKKSLLDQYLHEVEIVQAKFGRYSSPDEFPYTKDLPEPILPVLNRTKFLVPNTININEEIMRAYTENIVKEISVAGDDQNYGSSVTRDIELLQAISRRIHYGKVVAESKFRDPKNHHEYVRLIQAKDTDKIMALLTDTKVEEQLLARLRKKSAIFAQDIVAREKNSTAPLRIREDLVSETYREFLIPLTKKVEVDYLLQRLDGKPCESIPV